VNYSHLFPTRYQLELEGLKGTVSIDTFKEVSQREDAKKTVKKLFEDRYTSGKNRWFFTPLRVRSYITAFVLDIISRCVFIVLSASVNVYAMGL
jgi:Ribosomal L27e protein family